MQRTSGDSPPETFEGRWRKSRRLARFSSDTKTNDRLNLLVDITERLDRLPRHISVHPCGVILGNSSLLSLTPTEPSGIGLPMSQFDKDDMDPMGFLKLDVLGVRMQSAMAYTIREIARVKKKKVDLDSVDRDGQERLRTDQDNQYPGYFPDREPWAARANGKASTNQVQRPNAADIAVSTRSDEGKHD